MTVREGPPEDASQARCGELLLELWSSDSSCGFPMPKGLAAHLPGLQTEHVGPRSSSAAVHAWSGSSSSGFRFRQFLWGKLFLCDSVQFQGKSTVLALVPITKKTVLTFLALLL